jgi:PPE-repeat protein
MQLTLRSSLAAGVAAVGAGVIAVCATTAPAPVAAPQPASPDVTLGAAILPLPSPSVGSQALPAIGNAVASGADFVIAPVNSAAAALPALPLVPPGVQLSFLTGSPNLGAGNEGNFNTGFNNDGDFNTGINNEGNFNIGTDNEGSFNIGFNNVDSGNPVPGASDLDNVAVANIGIGNNGDFNVGANNTGSRNFGTNNVGALNVGTGNRGAFNLGANNTGTFNAGIGNTGSGNIGLFNTGDNNIGAFNSGNTIGVASIGIRNPLGSSAAAAKVTNADVAEDD